MGGMDVADGKPQKKGSGLKTAEARSSIRIDMTPMVDIAFLLLIFFMVTTVFRAPQAMEVNLPPAGAIVEVPESNVMTLYIEQREHLLPDGSGGPLTRRAMKDIQTALPRELRAQSGADHPRQAQSRRPLRNDGRCDG